MSSSRSKLINKGKVNQVYFDAEPDNILCEGNITKCRNFITEKRWWRLYKKGLVRIGEVIWEKD